MITRGCLVVLLSLVAGTAAAQSRVYGGGTVAIDSGSRGAYDTLGTWFPAVGGFIGFRVADAWSMEVHADRTFAESSERETVISAFERYVVQDRAGNGLAVLAVWKTRRQSRVGAAVTMGIAMRRFRTERVSDKEVDPSDGYPVDAGGGPVGGVLVPIVLGRGWSLAPELRAGVGVFGEHGGYLTFYSGVRAMWGF
jgi:hypothetical protein